MSLRAIARKLGMARNTVTKVVRAYEQAVREEGENGLSEYLAKTPRYTRRVSVPKVLTEGVCGEIDFWLLENERRRQNGMKKQCLNKQAIYRQLVEKGFTVSYSTVCRYTRLRAKAKRPIRRDVFVKQYYHPGEECEFDWGEVKLRIDGVLTTFTMAVFALCHSEGRRAYIFRHQDSLAFMESHRNFFRDVHGVPLTMVYDNMRVAVAFTGDGKKPTEALMRMCNFYGFDYRFCNARSGWEKGHVERSVDYVRGQAFTAKVDFPSIEDAQLWLDNVCDRLNGESASHATANKRERLEADLAALLPYPGEFGCFELTECVVDKLSTICVKNCHYSVPDTLAGQCVITQLYSEKIVVYDSQHSKVAAHQRSYRAGSWTIDINHYYNTLIRKPGAIDGSLALHQMPVKMKELFRVHFRNSGKDFIRLLRHAKSKGYGYDDIIGAVELIRSRGARHISADQVKAAMDSLKAQPLSFMPEQMTDAFLEIAVGSEDVLSQLDGLMEAKAQKGGVTA